MELVLVRDKSNNEWWTRYVLANKGNILNDEAGYIVYNNCVFLDSIQYLSYCWNWLLRIHWYEIFSLK